MENLLLLAILAAAAWFWLDSLKAREQAIAGAARACREIGLQLLDQTVALQSLGLTRHEQGYLVFKRIYSFEFSEQGVERRGGRAIMRGQSLEQVQLDQNGGTTIDQLNQPH